MKFEEGQLVSYRGYVGTIGFVDQLCITITNPSVIGNPWPISIVVYSYDFGEVYEVSSDVHDYGTK